MLRVLPAQAARAAVCGKAAALLDAHLLYCQIGVRHCSHSSDAGEEVGMGCLSSTIQGASRATVFKSMMNVIDMPGRFLPVSRVSIRPPTDMDAAEDGAIWRSLTFNGPGLLHGATIMEHIYANPSTGTIRFVRLDQRGKEGELEVIHQLAGDPMRIEYFQRHRASLERAHWGFPRETALQAIETTIALSVAQECQQSDPGFVGVKA